MKADIRRIISHRSFDEACRNLLQMAHTSERPLYLVGGAVRDVLLDRPVRDWDIAGENALDFAAEFARTQNARQVIIHEQHPTARVPVRNPRTGTHTLFDFCDLRAKGIRDDLADRDFTLNAIAIDLRTLELIDPLEGAGDIGRRTVRGIGRRNLADDPLRCVRAYRMAAELGFDIDSETREWIRQECAGLGRVASERIGEEMYKLIRPPNVSAMIDAMDADGVLALVLPELEEGRGMEQPPIHHLTVRDHSLEAMRQMEAMLVSPEDALPALHRRLENYLSQPLVAETLLMAALLHDIGKPACYETANGQMSFRGHSQIGAHMADEILKRWAWPSESRRIIVSLINAHLKPFQLSDLMQLPTSRDRRVDEIISLAAIRRLFRVVVPHEMGLILVALADSRAARGEGSTESLQVELEFVFDDLLRRYYGWQSEDSYEPILNGIDLIAAGYEAGPMFSVILDQVDDAHLEGYVETKEDALRMAENIAEDYLAGIQKESSEEDEHDRNV